MFGKKNIEVNAIQDKDLEEALKKTSQYKDLIQGKIKCQSCNTVITEKNIGVLEPMKNKDELMIQFYCEKIDCIEEFKKNINE